MNKKIVIGNWKMNPVSSKDAEKLFKAIVKNKSEYKNTDVVICPPNIFLHGLSKIKSGKISLGAQNTFYETKGAFTGQVSTQMLANYKVQYCIVGHSEMRAMGDTNEICNKKLNALLKTGITPILCVGEKMRDDSHEYLNIIRKQVKACLNGISKNSLNKIIIAYEPVWAIGSHAVREVTAAECEEMMLYIKKIIADLSDPKIAHNMRVIYGGSVHPKNSLELITDGSTDGFLVGRDSLNAERFAKIIRSTQIK